VTGSKTSTRDRIAASAQRLFAEKGFSTPVRAIAADAGVDPALVIRHFGSKELLFLEAISIDSILTDLTESGPLEGLGERIVQKLLSDEMAEVLPLYAALLRATDRAAVREKLWGTVEANLMGPLAPRLTGADARLRTRLIVMQIGGLLNALSLYPDDPILAEDQAALIDVYGRSIQHLIDNT
jgi:AcrR family transcriptional regulator